MNDLLDTDLYAALGVTPDADAGEITRAYRRLARDTHPDTHPDDPTAEERFKAVAAANEVLSDPAKRAEYDEFRAMLGRRGARTGRPGPQGAADADLGAIFGNLFGSESQWSGAQWSGPRRGSDVQGVITVDLLDLVEGTTVHVTLPDGQRVPVRVPAGVADGTLLRVPGRGLAGRDGAPNGDLLVEISVSDRAPFSREGVDLVVDVPVGFATATLGGTVKVPTLGGPVVTVRVPAGSGDGRRLRIIGRGLPHPGGCGDLHARLKVHVPSQLDDDTRAALESIRSRLEP